MKEHFNSVKPIFEGPKDLGLLNANTRRTGNQSQSIDDARENITMNDEAFELDPEAWYNSQMKNIQTYDEESIKGMDFNMALESARFVREMASNTEGRYAMSQAHGPVNPQKVIQLFFS
jgi:hypothetical protein